MRDIEYGTALMKLNGSEEKEGRGRKKGEGKGREQDEGGVAGRPGRPLGMWQSSGR